MKDDKKILKEALREQKEKVSSSKKAAKKLLVELGIYHILVKWKKQKS